MSTSLGTNIKRITELSQKAINLFLGLVLASFMTIVFAQTIFRYAFNSSIWWSEEISRYLFIWLIMLGVNVAIYQKDMLCLEVIDIALPRKAKEVTDLIVAILGLIVISGLLYCSILYYRDLGPNQIAPTLRIQIRYVVLCLPIGMLLSVWTQILVIIEKALIVFNKNYDRGEGMTNVS